MNGASQLLLLIPLIALNAIFVASECALLRANPLQLKNAAKKNRKRSRAALRLMGDIDDVLSATQLAVTAINLLIGWWGIGLMSDLVIDAFAHFNVPIAGSFVVPVSVALAVLAMIVVHAILGELATRSFAARYPEETLCAVSALLAGFVRLFRPIVHALRRAADFVIRLIGAPMAKPFDRMDSLAELSFLVSKSTERGLLAKDEEQMLRGVFGLAETVARELMTPRADVVTILADAPLSEVLKTVIESGLSRFPVVGEHADDIIGVVLARDLLRHFGRHERTEEFSLRRLMREPYFVPGTMPAHDLLSEFKKRSHHFAIVLNEHGGLEGVVSLEDLIEEIVGDIFDESDIAERSVVTDENGDILLDGGLLVADVNSRFDLDIPEGDYDTIAGFIFTSLGRIPKQGDRLVVEKAEASRHPAPGAVGNGTGAPDDKAAHDPSTHKVVLSVEKIDSHRIETVRLRESPPPIESFPHPSSSEAKS